MRPGACWLRCCQRPWKLTCLAGHGRADFDQAGGGGDWQGAEGDTRIGKILPLPCVSTASAAQKVPLPRVSTAFVPKALPFLADVQGTGTLVTKPELIEMIVAENP